GHPATGRQRTPKRALAELVGQALRRPWLRTGRLHPPTSLVEPGCRVVVCPEHPPLRRARTTRRKQPPEGGVRVDGNGPARRRAPRALPEVAKAPARDAVL